MLEVSHSRLGRLKGMRMLFQFLLVAPTRRSLLLFNTLIKELDSMILEWETELQLESLVLAKQSVTANPPFHDGDHLVEDHMPQKQPDDSTGSMK